MLRKFLLAVAASLFTFFAATGFAFAAVDANTADQAQLESVKGIGPAIATKIIAERKKGNFKDWKDLEDRISGIGDKNSVKFSQAGLTVGGQAKANAPAMAETKTTTKTTKKSDAMTPAAKTDAAVETKTTTTKKADVPAKADAMATTSATTKKSESKTTDTKKSDAKKDDAMKK